MCQCQVRSRSTMLLHHHHMLSTQRPSLVQRAEPGPGQATPPTALLRAVHLLLTEAVSCHPQREARAGAAQHGLQGLQDRRWVHGRCSLPQKQGSCHLVMCRRVYAGASIMPTAVHASTCQAWCASLSGPVSDPVQVAGRTALVPCLCRPAAAEHHH
jgi:hypothetical protein